MVSVLAPHEWSRTTGRLPVPRPSARSLKADERGVDRFEDVMAREYPTLETLETRGLAPERAVEPNVSGIFR